MTKSPRLDAPSADLRPLDRGPATKKVFGVEPRVCPPAAQEIAKREVRWKAEEEQRLAKSPGSASPGPTVDLSKQLKEMERYATQAVKAAEQSAKNLKAMEAIVAKAAAPTTLKQALAKIDQAAQKKAK